MSSSGIDDMLCSFVFSGYFSVLKHIIHEFAASCKTGKYIMVTMPLIVHVKWPPISAKHAVSLLHIFGAHIVHICPLVCLGLAIGHCLTL